MEKHSLKTLLVLCFEKVSLQAFSVSDCWIFRKTGSENWQNSRKQLQARQHCGYPLHISSVYSFFSQFAFLLTIIA